MRKVMNDVREHIKTCPFLHLDESHGFGVDFLAEDDTAYMIEAVPAPPVIKSYINGDAEKQFVFAFSTRESYGANAEQNLANLETLDSLAEWFDECSKNANLPEIGEGAEALRYEVLSTGYAYRTSVNQAQYRMQCRLVYFCKGE
jgi:hypothetical protein